MHILLVGKTGPMVLGALLTIAHIQVAMAQSSALELPPPSTWHAMSDALSKLTQTEWAHAISTGEASASSCQWSPRAFRCNDVRWQTGQMVLKAKSISWPPNQTGGPRRIEQGQWKKTRFQQYRPKELRQVRQQYGAMTISIDVLTLKPKMKLQGIQWEKHKRRVALARSATKQGEHWILSHFTRLDVWPTQHRATLNTKTPIQHLAGWLAPQVLWSRGAGVELQGMYAWPAWSVGLGATINPNNYYMLTGALFSSMPDVDTLPLKLSIGANHDGARTYSAFGQWRLGDAYKHLDVDAQWTKQPEQWATGRLTTNQVLSPFARTRLGLSASADIATTQLALFEDTTQQGDPARGMSMVFGTQRALNRNTSLRLNVWHLGIFERGEQPTLNQSDVQFGLNWQLGQLDRVYLRAQASGWMLLQVEEVLQGWSATSAGRLTAQAETGVAITGHFDGIRHDLTPKLIAFEQPFVRVKRDNLIAQPIPTGTRQTWGAYQLQVAQSIQIGDVHHIEVPVGVAWLRNSEHAWLGVARLRYRNDRWETAIEANLVRFAEDTGWHAHIELPPLGGLSVAYGVGQMSNAQMSLVSLLSSNSMSMQTMLLQRHFDIVEEEDNPSAHLLRHLGRLSWTGDTHAMMLHGSLANRSWWSGALTHQYKLNGAGWSIRTTGFALNDETQTQFGLGFGMMQRFD